MGDEGDEQWETQGDGGDVRRIAGGGLQGPSLSRKLKRARKESPMERDPVCGMNVDPEKAKAKVDHGEKSYYFCSAGCAKKFEQTPQQFLSKSMPAAGSHGSQIAAATKPAMGSLPILGSAPTVPMVKHPVCGLMLDLQRAAGKAEYAGKTYFFCSPRCKERFEKEPEKFLVTPG